VPWSLPPRKEKGGLSLLFASPSPPARHEHPRERKIKDFYLFPVLTRRKKGKKGTLMRPHRSPAAAEEKRKEKKEKQFRWEVGQVL